MAPPRRPTDGPVGSPSEQAQAARFRARQEIGRQQANRLAWAKANPTRRFYKQWVSDGPGRVKPGLQKLKNPYYRAPQAAPAAAPTTPTNAPAPAADPGEPVVAQAGAASSGGINLKGVFKPYQSINPTALMAPATRLLAKQRTDAEAARTKATTDLQAFYDYLRKSQEATQGGLATSLGTIAKDASAAREESLGRVRDSVAQAVVASGGNADLQQQAGLTATLAQQQSLQQGQDLSGTAQQAVQAGLSTRAADQGRVNDAFAAGMPLELSRAYNTRVKELNESAMSNAEKLAALKVQDLEGRNAYESNQAAQNIAAQTANAELGGKDADRQLKADIATQENKTKRAIAAGREATARAVENGRMSRADAAAINKARDAALNRKNARIVQGMKNSAKADTGGPADLDKLGSSIAQSVDLSGLTTDMKAEEQEQLATQFVQSARTQFGNAQPWQTIVNIMNTYFPDYMARPGARTALKRYWS